MDGLDKNQIGESANKTGYVLNGHLSERKQRGQQKMLPHEIRYYKGKLPVKVIQKSKKNWLVQEMGIRGKMFFVTVPRLLWKKPKCE